MRKSGKEKLNSFNQNSPKNTTKEKRKVSEDNTPRQMRKVPKKAKIPPQPIYKDKKKDKPNM